MTTVTATTFQLLGSQFQLGNGGSPTETFTTISQVTAVDFGSYKADTIDVTTADNTDGFRRFSGTLQDPGDVSVTLLYNPNDATHAALLAARNAGNHNFKEVVPNFLTRSWNGVITSWEEKLTLDKATEVTLKIKISGPLTLA